METLIFFLPLWRCVLPLGPLLALSFGALMTLPSSYEVEDVQNTLT